jgi:hypothetical protein
MFLRIILVAILLSMFFAGCDHGLAPPEENMRTAISGLITYQNWPSPDSLKDLRLIVFQNYPPRDIIFEVTSGRAHVYPPLGASGLEFYVDSSRYILNLSPGHYQYVVVAQQYGDNLYSDWRAVGQYDTTGVSNDSIPSSIDVIENCITENINISVDFDNPPVQPFDL